MIYVMDWQLPYYGVFMYEKCGLSFLFLFFILKLVSNANETTASNMVLDKEVTTIDASSRMCDLKDFGLAQYVVNSCKKKKFRSSLN
jgi:hypothetical protein